LEAGAIVCNMPHLVQNLVNQLLPYGIMTASIIIRSVFFSSDHLLGMEKAPVSASSYFVNYVWLEVAVNCTRHIFPLASFGEEGAESLVRVRSFAFFGEKSVRLNSMLKTVQLPARVRNLTTGLANVQAYDFPHDEERGVYV
jgi:hypothetical protein